MLSDVHGNAVALAAVLAELEPVDLVVFGGDLTWGPLPQETLALVVAPDLLGTRAGPELPDFLRTAAGDCDLGGPLERLVP